ncbi:MAG: MlaD family protein [Cyanobium sp.]
MGKPRLQKLAVLGGATLLLAGFAASMGEARRWLTPTTRLQFRTLSAGVLSPGMGVKISGFPVGRVRSIRLQNDAQVLVELDLEDRYRAMVGRRSRAELAQDGLLGNTYIALTPDPAAFGQAPIRSGETLLFTSQPTVNELLLDLADTRVLLEKTLRGGANLAEWRVPRNLDELDRTLVRARGLAGHLQTETGTSARELNRTLASSRQLASRMAGRANAPRAGIDSLVKGAGQAEREAVPQLLATLRELNTMATSTNRLVKTLNESWLLQLMERPLLGPGRGGGAPRPAEPPAGAPSRAPLADPQAAPGR